YNGDHLSMDLFSARIRGRWRLALNGFMTVVLLACCAFALTQSLRVVSLFVQTGSVSVSAGVPKAIPHAALVVGFALTILAVIVRIRSYFTGKF
ncbi:MAG: TRAP transporter small permease, partial [Burkholderiales bacterium]